MMFDHDALMRLPDDQFEAVEEAILRMLSEATVLEGYLGDHGFDARVGTDSFIVRTIREFKNDMLYIRGGLMKIRREREASA